jgi:hypothetical protein
LEFDDPSQYLPNLHPVDIPMNLKRILAALGLALLAWSAFALPTLEAVQAAIGQGNYVQAETMMSEVVAAKPNSAKAHYLYAEILAHNKRFDQATAQAAQAKSIDPSLKFTQPEKFRAFEQLLEREHSAAQNAKNANVKQAPERKVAAAVTPAPAPSSSLPTWIWALGGAAAALLAWRLWNGRQQAAANARAGNYAAPAAAGVNSYSQAYAPAQAAGYGAPQAAGYGAPQAAGYGAPQAPGYYPPQQAPRSGMLGTGMAVAGGMAAGMLAAKLFEGYGDGASAGHAAAQGSSQGLTPGLFDDAQGNGSAAQELQQRPIDYGNGQDWGGDDAAPASDDGW